MINAKRNAILNCTMCQVYENAMRQSRSDSRGSRLSKHNLISLSTFTLNMSSSKQSSIVASRHNFETDRNLPPPIVISCASNESSGGELISKENVSGTHSVLISELNRKSMILSGVNEQATNCKKAKSRLSQWRKLLIQAFGSTKQLSRNSSPAASNNKLKSIYRKRSNYSSSSLKISNNLVAQHHF